MVPTTTELVVLTIHLIATAAMTGVIWFVQVVHYPLFAAVGDSNFVDYEREHTRRTGFVVGPFMAAEGVTTLWLFFAPVDGRLLPLVGGLLLAVVLGSTIAVQVPLHDTLSTTPERAAMQRLVRSNWIRTIGWSLRTVVAAVILISAV
ncbi:MAG: hypothetical protein ACKOA2_10400 [Ilumatobacteraceae bacterium]